MKKSRLQELAGIKKPLNEGNMWDRNEDGSMPTLADTTARYAAMKGKSLQEAPLMATKLDSEVYDRIDGLTNTRLLQELLDKAIQIQDDQIKAGDDFDREDLALYLGMKILDVLD